MSGVERPGFLKAMVQHEVFERDVKPQPLRLFKPETFIQRLMRAISSKQTRSRKWRD